LDGRARDLVLPAVADVVAALHDGADASQATRVAYVGYAELVGTVVDIGAIRMSQTRNARLGYGVTDLPVWRAGGVRLALDDRVAGAGKALTGGTTIRIDHAVDAEAILFVTDQVVALE